MNNDMMRQSLLLECSTQFYEYYLDFNILYTALSILLKLGVKTNKKIKKYGIIYSVLKNYN